MLARINKRKDFKMEIKNKIGNENEIVNEEAFRAYLSFVDEKADLDFLMSKYDLANDSVRKLIIKALAKYPDKAKTIEFLDKIVQKKPFTQKIEAIRLLLDLDISAVSRYKDAENPQIRQSYLQVLDINL
jgi:HEAT repeat protein